MTSYRQKIISLFDLPIYTSTGVRRIEDLDRLRIWNVLDGFSEEKAESVIALVKPVVSICPELAICFLRKFCESRNLLNNGFLDGWIEAVLDIYDKKGLQKARLAVLHFEECHDVKCLFNQGVQLKKIIRVLKIYIDGLGAKDIKLAEGEVHYTDTLVIYLPSVVSIFPDQVSNFLLYKLMATHKLVQIRLGTFKLHNVHENRPESPQIRTRLSVLLNRFPDIALARDLFQLLDTVRIEAWIYESLPGLHRDLMDLKNSLAAQMRWSPNLYPKSALMVFLIRTLLGQEPNPDRGDKWAKEASQIWELFGLARRPESKLRLLEKILARTYKIASKVPGHYRPVRMGFYIGELRLNEVERVLGASIGPAPEGEGKAIKVNLETIPDNKDLHAKDSDLERGGSVLSYDAETNSISGESKTAQEETSHFSPGFTWEIPNPSGHLSALNESDVFYFDEWDFRRQGYKKNWVHLREFEVQEGDLSFSESVLIRNKWTIKNIREQFERIRMNCLLRRRQKEGDNIDLDAVVENLCQIKAGRSPSENLYTSLTRDERDICTVFLIDLSKSTEGSINIMERSALLILAKTLETLNDRFAIYGFSGQTRKYCELFRIKSFHESFGDKVMGRIAGLRPRHCTRIGPPIRRLTNILHPMAAKNKLLVALTDGKPYDYDGYHGEYALADTHQAIMEARRKGIVPFCLTIDKTEHAYLTRMYGDGHYMFIDDISKIPQMMPKVYIKLTT